jgi:hypothetical protein
MEERLSDLGVSLGGMEERLSDHLLEEDFSLSSWVVDEEGEEETIRSFSCLRPWILSCVSLVSYAINVESFLCFIVH